MENIGLGLALKVNISVLEVEKSKNRPIENLENIVIQKGSYVIIELCIKIKKGRRC